MLTEETYTVFERIIELAWLDQEFKERLKTSPNSVFAEMGAEIPEGVNIHVVENTEQDVYFTLPVVPPENRLSCEMIERTSAGWRNDPTGYGTCPTWHPTCPAGILTRGNDS